jgi:hypothetical protein
LLTTNAEMLIGARARWSTQRTPSRRRPGGCDPDSRVFAAPSADIKSNKGSISLKRETAARGAAPPESLAQALDHTDRGRRVDHVLALPPLANAWRLQRSAAVHVMDSRAVLRVAYRVRQIPTLEAAMGFGPGTLLWLLGIPLPINIPPVTFWR